MGSQDPRPRAGRLVRCDVMPRLAPVGKTADFAIVQAARVSYGEGTRKVTEDRGLIRYLARHRHTTPFEMVEFKFHHVMPIFIAAMDPASHRQRQRIQRPLFRSCSATASTTPLAPKTSASKSTTNRQGGDEPMDEMTAREFCRIPRPRRGPVRRLRTAHRQRRRPRIGPHRPARKRLHRVVLEM